jgi:hypothetical protein
MDIVVLLQMGSDAFRTREGERATHLLSDDVHVT